MNVSDFDFFLPEKLIAQNPVSPRDYCRLMVINRESGLITHKRFFDLEELLQPGDVLVMNDSKVIPARLLFEQNGRKIELFLIRQKDSRTWTAIGKPGRYLLNNSVLDLGSGLVAHIIDVDNQGIRTVEFNMSGQILMNKIHEIGVTPLPPYIKHSTSSLADYQTVYSKHAGSVAAPTAGLHFTDKLLNRLRHKGIDTIFVTLHVGLGTFLPVKSKRVTDHTMHREEFYLSPQNARILQVAKNMGKRIIAVGTTSVRVLESTYYNDEFHSGWGETNIYIYPGYRWKCVNGLITNFHLPQSTLIMLVSAFASRKLIMDSYSVAKKLGYRFYSYGDSMLIL